MSIEAVIWDLGGVLVRTEDRTRRLAWEQELELDPGQLDKLVFEGTMGKAAAMGRATSSDIWRSLGEQFNLSASKLSTLESDFWAGDRVDRDLINMIYDHRSMSIATGLLSNAWPDLRLALEEIWAIADAFDEIVISAEVALAKPDHRIYELILERMGMEPPQCVFVDDFIENIEAARALGMQAIHFTSSTSAREQLRRLLEPS